MIRSVRIRGFKRFRDTEFRLPGHAVLTGPNDTGKTTLLQAIASCVDTQPVLTANVRQTTEWDLAHSNAVLAEPIECCDIHRYEIPDCQVRRVSYAKSTVCTPCQGKTAASAQRKPSRSPAHTTGSEDDYLCISLITHKPQQDPLCSGSDMTDRNRVRDDRREAHAGGIQMRAGDRPYFPPGALQIWENPDGSTGTGASLAVDPWLPDLSISAGTPTYVMDKISKNGFPVSTICDTQLVNGCQKLRLVRELVAHPEAPRLRYMLVLDGTQVCGILDLDRARGAVRHNDPKQMLVVEEIYEPLNVQNCIQGESPLIDYLLSADERPFRVVELPGHKAGTVDVEDLQKLPVRVLLFMIFSHLETLIAGQLCSRYPPLQEIVATDRGIESDHLGNSGIGPERKIERYKFGQLLWCAKRESFISISGDEISFIERFRNNLVHGPRWYITRRSEIVSLVKCLRKVTDLINEVKSHR